MEKKIFYLEEKDATFDYIFLHFFDEETAKLKKGSQELLFNELPNIGDVWQFEENEYKIEGRLWLKAQGQILETVLMKAVLNY